MGIATVIPENTFDGLQLDAGVLLTSFDPNDPEILDVNIVCATTGGIQVSCVPTYSDFGEDVDNCPNNMKELKHLDSWECKISTTCLGNSVENIRLALGAADVTAASSKIVPRKDLSQSDFADLWWVGDKADGGLVAVKIINALSTGGYSLQTTKNGKGQVTLELTGHVSINAQNVMPMEFYSLDGDDAVVPSVQITAHVARVKVGSKITLTAKTVPSSASVTWTSSVTAKATVNASTGEVTGVQTGSTIITATITDDGVSYSDTCTVIVEAAS